MEADGGLQNCVATPTLSAVETVHVLILVLFPGLRISEKLGEHEITGFWLSMTVMLKLQEAVLPALSVAEHETTLIPTGKVVVPN